MFNSQEPTETCVGQIWESRNPADERDEVLGSLSRKVLVVELLPPHPYYRHYGVRVRVRRVVRSEQEPKVTLGRLSTVSVDRFGELKGYRFLCLATDCEFGSSDD